MSATIQASLQNYNTLVQNSVAAAQAESNTPLNFENGSVLLALLQADAAQALWLQYLIVLLLSVTRLATSSGSDCDSFGADFGFTRLPAVNAVGNVTFSRFTYTQSAFIPVGAQVQTADGTQTFNVTANPTNIYYVATPTPGYLIPAGTQSINTPVVAVNSGTQGNVLGNTITQILGGIPGVDTVINAAAISGGVNAESDAAFKARFVNFVNSRTEATAFAAGYAVQQIQQGLSWTIQENVTANGTYSPGTYVVTVDDGTGSPPSTLISEVNTAVQAVRPIGSMAIVQGPTKITANISLHITVASGANLATIQTEITTALTNYISSLSVGATLPYSRLAQIAYDADTSVINVTTVLLNAGTSDIVATQSEVVRPGTITFT